MDDNGNEFGSGGGVDISGLHRELDRLKVQLCRCGHSSLCVCLRALQGMSEDVTKKRGRGDGEQQMFALYTAEEDHGSRKQLKLDGECYGGVLLRV